MARTPRKKHAAASKDGSDQRYRAPALEKGLEILELLSGQREPLMMAAISERLGRSTSELFRMLQVLEQKGYIEKAPSGDGFRITNRLFTLGMAQPPVKALIEVALPVMRRLAGVAAQSCHLVVPSSDEIIVIARIEAPGELGFSVRTGYRRSMARATSGIVLFAFQPREVQQQWLRVLEPAEPPEVLERLTSLASDVRKQGYGRFESDFVRGVTDLSAPILRGDHAVAALTVPFVESRPLKHTMEETVPLVREAAVDISNTMTFGDHP
ncbi:MAG: IclR family transcriptional regulator [Sphingomonadales bacterium]|nr:IclR family transcriptional regulator [Sphingomonadales bacterium]